MQGMFSTLGGGRSEVHLNPIWQILGFLQEMLFSDLSRSDPLNLKVCRILLLGKADVDASLLLFAEFSEI